MTSDANPCCTSIQDLLPTALFRALADPNRVAILCDLCECNGGPKTVGELAETLPVDLSVASRHLGVLRDAQVLHAERRGRNVCYRVRVDELVALLRSLADALEGCCTPAGPAAEEASKP